MNNDKLDYDRLEELARSQQAQLEADQLTDWQLEAQQKAERMVSWHERVGYDVERAMFFIRHVVVRFPDAEVRCPTCGRTTDCCCPGCDCSVRKIVQ